MTLELLRGFFGWCAILNLGILLWWFLFISLAHDLTYRWHCHFFNLSVEDFNRIHYTGLAYFKVAIFFFNVVPYFAVRILS